MINGLAVQRLIRRRSDETKNIIIILVDNWKTEL